MRRPAAVVALALALAGCGGASPSAEGLYNRALASLTAGDLDSALASAEAAAARGGPDFAARRDFVRGNVAFARSEEAEAAAARPGAEPTLLERARAFAEDAVGAWRLADASRDDWPAARRNVERGLLRLARLREKKAGGGSEGPKPPAPAPPTPDVPPPPPPPPQPPPPADGGMDEALNPAPAAYEPPDLAPEKVAGLLEVLARKEAERQALRRETRRAASRGVERDW